MSTDIELIGVEDLAAQLRQMALKRGEAKAMLTEALQPIAEQAGNTIPRSAKPRSATARNPWRTGLHLADHVSVEGRSMTAGVTYEGGLQNGPFFYGKFGEFGTRRESPRMWIEMAAETRETEVLDTIERELKQKLEV